MVSEKQISEYLKQLKRAVPCRIQQQELNNIENGIVEYLEEHPNSTIDDIIQHFGTPQTFFNVYLESMSCKEKYTAMTYKKFLLKISLIFAFIIIIFNAIAISGIKQEISKPAIYYYYDKITNYSD